MISLRAGRGWTCNINNEPHIITTLFWTKMCKNYLIFLSLGLGFTFDGKKFVQPHSYLYLAKQFTLVTGSQTRKKYNKIIQLRWAKENALVGQIRPMGHSLYGPALRSHSLVSAILSLFVSIRMLQLVVNENCFLLYERKYSYNVKYL